MALQSVLDRHVGKRAVGSILRAMPSVLNTSSDTIDWHFEELATMLGPDTAASLAVKAPFILCMAPFMVWSKLTFLQRLLGISIESAQAIVVRQPRLLCMAQAALEARLRELQSMAR
ncbi:hypothetical protein DUNSADRAFT_4194 [Dunaliella salina]|uniref:Encoded protein n=1 Tax=Dunaliella salina TaxID=3046 RepID=A0ABQ7GSJ1_DUNSA|nr:hypothetical protein DUNSADRAFT_4194 [Dunaliella salina]|eukprot:KAF5837558.1 hypothetical protein DUNSADRAFT_4194 [Dunaliella salina]